MSASRVDSKRDGRRLRAELARDAVSSWVAPPDRRDPIDALLAQDADRISGLVPIRYGRMSASPFAFLRGSAAVMAADLATVPTTGLTVQACGDAHVANFGSFASPERRLVFDINDFDETLAAPWESDVRRLAASIAVVARGSGLSDDTARGAACSVGVRYRTAMRKYATMRTLDIWYASVSVREILDLAKAAGMDGSVLRGVQRQAKRHDNLHAMPKLSEIVGDQRVIRNRPPLVVRVSDEYQDEARAMYYRYVDNLPEERQQLLSRFTVDDVALKVVGVGSVGTRCFVVLLHGADADDPLVLQVKQATRSVLATPGQAVPAHHGHRVVAGQRAMQSASDIVLGWTTGLRGRHYYWRQMWDAKASVDPSTLDADRLSAYAGLCAAVLARAHARTGNPAEIAGYLGKRDAFAEALGGFAIDYADQTERDHAALLTAVRSGRVPAETGV